MNIIAIFTFILISLAGGAVLSVLQGIIDSM